MKSPRATKKADAPSKGVVALDKKLLCFHEAGHAVVGLRLGAAMARLTITRDFKRNLKIEKAFAANCSTWRLRGKLNVAARAYAGVIAESLYSHEDFTVTEDEMWAYLDCGMAVPSETDLIGINGIHRNYQLRAVKRSLEILKEHWTVVRGVAFELHQSHRGMIFIGPAIFKQTKWLGLL